MEAAWHEREGGMKYLPHILWILLLALLTAFVGLNIYGWAVTAFMTFLIYPRFWEGREKRGKGPSVRIIFAAMFTMLLAYSAWTRVGEPLPFIGAEAKAAVAASLRDPASAEFRNIKTGTSATCGEVNGKNAFGSYVGFKPFVYADGIVRIEPEEPIVFSVPEQTSYYNAVAEFARASRRCYE